MTERRIDVSDCVPDVVVEEMHGFLTEEGDYDHVGLMDRLGGIGYRVDPGCDQVIEEYGINQAIELKSLHDRGEQ